MKSLLLRTLNNETVERPPVWMMRQAGRYLSEYLAVKEQYGFLGMCRTPDVCVEVTLQPLRYLDVDAAIIFSDIMVPVQAMGLDVEFKPGPVIGNPIRNSADVEALRVDGACDELGFVYEALGMLRNELTSFKDEKALIGFAGSPWTLACYAIDQGPFKHFQGTQVFARREPAAIHALLSKLTTVVGDFMLKQIEAGAQVVQLFDSWGGNLSAEDYREFSLPYIAEIIARVKQTNTPCTLYVGNSPHLLHLLGESGATCISVDWRTPLATAQELVGDNIVLQGNLDPTLLFGTAAEVRQRTIAMLEKWPKQSGLIANLGHGILPTTPRENALAFVETIRDGWHNA